MSITDLSKADISEDTHAEQDATLLNGLATVHIMFGMHSTALKFLELSNWVRPDSRETLHLLAKSYFNMGASVQVLDVFYLIESLDTDGTLTEEELMMKGRSFALLGQTEKARNVLSSISS
ncbi:hypothetical protein F9L33_09540 [Amylibacter sp. SFDW26]|uniref:tetratricopeptide repeat protein n=1 Tax=Amylibacter sp. SFDW26 TaxID=2652722 RepID=UPI0012618C87|nr:hypothetical protein [Amylibacter sp. SFDW26]KAB7613613.1 hypothetical protein F9L33_09540 [Amylibacter sp. SFDW26]